ncbi:MAG: hypothetical protein KDC83_00760 [Flavobacteriales bacterium]|nr:hypothetical protein [Flavobacteriales bacterium]
MKMLMKSLAISMIAITCFTIDASAQKKKKADKAMHVFRYEIECMGTGVQGTYLIKVWSYSKKATIAQEWSKKDAIHGVIFKGFAGANGCQSQKPLSRNPDLMQEQEAFFDEFFDTKTGGYRQFVNLTTDGVPSAGDVQKVGKEYKVGLVVSVNKDALRKYLEDKGIIKGLASGF